MENTEQMKNGSQRKLTEEEIAMVTGGHMILGSDVFFGKAPERPLPGKSTGDPYPGTTHRKP